ncbi:MAG: aldolase/citrate lyase family protein [Candidatus Bipolaricaulota bacterium]|nr:hypothetical protein [Candidatus Bipolaricaulota bacterium]MBS3791405.1 hypothetical protein [Candidatus Bipolaricaulota bacterium]
MNQINKLIDRTDQAVGTFLCSRSQAALEVLAGVGFDFVVIDAEHFMVNPETIERLVTAAESADVVPFVRVQENVDLVQRTLDCGAKGIIAPMINSGEEAREIVNAAKFPPIGKRGVGNPRSTNYGVGGAEYMDKCYEHQNENQAVIIQIETKEALENLPDIIGIEGLDSLFIGPWDLSHSLDQPGPDEGSQIFEDKINEVLEKCKKKEVPVGIFSWGSKEANERVHQGFDYVICGADVIFLANSAKEELTKIRD